MCRGLVQEDDIEAVAIVLAQLLQKDGEAVGIEAGPLPPEGVAGGGLYSGIEPVRLVEGLDDLDRLHAVARQPPVQRQLQAQATFILTENPYRLVRRLTP